MRAPARPLVAVLGGSKVTDKIGVIERFLELADAVLIGGAMSFPFLAAQGHGVGDSLCEREGIAVARRLLADADDRLHLPLDLVVGDRLSADAELRVVDADGIEDGWMGLDIGPRTQAAYAAVVEAAGTAFWNGPLGAFELEPFAAGTPRDRRGDGAHGRGDHRRRRRSRRRAEPLRPRRPRDPHLHRRRCRPGVHRGPRAAGVRGARPLSGEPGSQAAIFAAASRCSRAISRSGRGGRGRRGSGACATRR